MFYDHLVLALGSETNFFKLPGVEERALTMKSLGDAFFLRNHALALLEIASLTEDEAARRAMLTFVVAGGGFAGTETVGALNDYLRAAKKYYPALAKNNVRVVLVHPSAVLLPETRRKPRTIRARETRGAECRDSAGDACGRVLRPRRGTEER